MIERAALVCFLAVTAAACDERAAVPLEPSEATSAEEVRAAAERTRQTTNAELEKTRKNAEEHAPALPQSSGKNE